MVALAKIVVKLACGRTMHDGMGILLGSLVVKRSRETEMNTDRCRDRETILKVRAVGMCLSADGNNEEGRRCQGGLGEEASKELRLLLTLNQGTNSIIHFNPF